MKFNNLNSYRNYLDTVLEGNELSLSISDIFSSLIGRNNIANKNEIELLAEKSHHPVKEVLLSKITEELDIDLTVEDDEEIFNKYIAGSISELDPKEYLENPFYQKFKDINFKEDRYELKVDKLSAYELFAYKDMEVFPNSYIEKNSIGYFKTNYPYLTLNEKNVTWMSIIPNEIETMKKPLEEAKGDILVFGLGLGYFAYMAALKSEVKSITVIEKDQHIINLFNKCLFPHFENRAKIKIICKDALEFCKTPIKANFVYIDLWHDPFDGLELFLKFKSIERKYPHIMFRYWLESSFYLLLRRCMFTLINEQLDGYGDSHYLKAESYLDKVINKYYFATKKLSLSSKEDLDNLLSDKTLVSLLLDDR